MLSIELSEEQIKVFNKSGKFIVRACAGSGKTFTISKKLAQLINNNPHRYQGVATISFTNVAWKEIRDNLNEWNISVDYPHFLGTIDHFINDQIFYKYYYLLDEFKERPVIVGGKGKNWEGKNQYENAFDKVYFDINGKLCQEKSAKLDFKFGEKNKDGSSNKHYINVKKARLKLFKKGYVTQSDINYFSLKLLNHFPFIVKHISYRFPQFIIDEAQDTNEIQMNILCIILEKVKDFIFIGDFNQSIYEWRNAKPELFKNLEEKYNIIELNENWRSSQQICDFSSKLSLTNTLAVNEKVKDFSYKPEIKIYKNSKGESGNKDIKKIINDFLKVCKENNIKVNADNVAVLTRSNELIKRILNKDVSEEDMWIKNNITKNLVHSKCLHDNNSIHDSYKMLKESIVDLESKNKKTTKKLIDRKDFFDFKKYLFELLYLMPSTINKPLKLWIKEFRSNLSKSKVNLKYKLIKELKFNINNDSFIINDLFETANTNSRNCFLSTVHKAKGKSYEAVLVILKSGYKNTIKNFMSDKDNIMDEKLRIVYVAITRPSKILMLAVPDTDEKEWNELFFPDKSQTKLDAFRS